MMLVALPFFMLLCILSVFLQGFPIFFVQERIGAGFKPFQIVKFRTMKSESEDIKGLTKGYSDNRITRIGLIFRKLKLDELPQLYNVLIGEMSIVGSRPQVFYYTEKYKEYYKQILSRKPGLFSPAAMAYSNEEKVLDQVDDPVKYYEDVLVPAKCRMDIELVKKLNVKMYFKVLWGYVRFFWRGFFSRVRMTDKLT